MNEKSIIDNKPIQAEDQMKITMPEGGLFAKLTGKTKLSINSEEIIKNIPKVDINSSKSNITTPKKGELANLIGIKQINRRNFIKTGAKLITGVFAGGLVLPITTCIDRYELWERLAPIYGLAIGGSGTTTTEKYNSSENSWSTQSSMTSVRNFSGTFSLSIDYGFAAGGAPGGLNSLERYSDSTNTWNNRASFITGRRGMARFSLGSDYGFIAGGNGPSSLVDRLFGSK